MKNLFFFIIMSLIFNSCDQTIDPCNQDIKEGGISATFQVLTKNGAKDLNRYASAIVFDDYILFQSEKKGPLFHESCTLNKLDKQNTQVQSLSVPEESRFVQLNHNLYFIKEYNLHEINLLDFSSRILLQDVSLGFENPYNNIRILKIFEGELYLIHNDEGIDHQMVISLIDIENEIVIELYRYDYILDFGIFSTNVFPDLWLTDKDDIMISYIRKKSNTQEELM